MNRAELIDAMAKDTGLTKKDTEATLKSFIENVSKTMEKGEDVALVGFGTFYIGERPARTGRNPKTGEKITIASCKTPKFKAGKTLKDRVRGK